MDKEPFLAGCETG